MPTTSKSRRSINLAKVLTIALLATPALLPFFSASQTGGENRQLASMPEKPDSLDAVLKYPLKLDAWINDHFGFREELIRLNNQIRYSLFRQFPTIQVIAGKNDRIFLSAHATTHTPYSAILMGCGNQFNQLNDIVAQLNDFSGGLRAMGLDAKIMIAPSGPILYSDELPGWLEKQCKSTPEPIPRVLASPDLSAEAKLMIYYPIEPIRKVRHEIEIIPKTWFHWIGAGPRLVADASTAYFWKKDAKEYAPLATTSQLLASDISHMFPGVELKSKVEVPDYAGSGVRECRGPGCFPELQATMTKLVDVSHYVNEKLPAGRLVLLSDSFGQYIAGWYARYYREVVHVSTNNLNQLDKSELKQLTDTLLRQDDKSDMLFLYHDVSLINGRVTQDVKLFKENVFHARLEQPDRLRPQE